MSWVSIQIASIAALLPNARVKLELCSQCYYKKGCGYLISFRSVEGAKTEAREVTISMFMSLKKSAGHWEQSLLQQQRKSKLSLGNVPQSFIEKMIHVCLQPKQKCTVCSSWCGTAFMEYIQFNNTYGLILQVYFGNFLCVLPISFILCNHLQVAIGNNGNKCPFITT